MGRRGVQVVDWVGFVERTGLVDGAAVYQLALDGAWCDSRTRELVQQGRDAFTARRWVKALDVAQWHHHEGLSIAACGRRMGVSRQAAAQMLALVATHYPAAKSDATDQDARAATLMRVFVDAASALRATPGISLDELEERTGATAGDIKMVLAELMAYVSIPAPAQKRTRWRDRDILATLRKVHGLGDGKPLTKRSYATLVDEHELDAPSHALISKRFDSWSAALRAADLPYYEAGQRYSWARSKQQALEDILEFIVSTGRTSVAAYGAWAQGQPGRLKVPQAVVSSSQTWASALNSAFAELIREPWKRRFEEMVDSQIAARADALVWALGVEAPRVPSIHVPHPADALPGE